MNGFLVIDKPPKATSRDVVNRAQRWFPRKTKLGHTGTLDPLATGMLVLAVGAATRLTAYVQDMPKAYLSRFRLGARSSTDDADGDVAEIAVVGWPTRGEIEAALPAFLGEVWQVPPAFSAVKLAGRRAYDLARRGEAVAISARRVRVDAVRVLAYQPPLLDLEIDCGKGTYIRSIARDLGEALGCGGMVETLRRTRIGPFGAEEAIGLDAEPDAAADRLLPMSRALAGLGRTTIDGESARRFRHGGTIPLPEGISITLGENAEVAVCEEGDRLVGIGTVGSNATVRPTIVFPPAE